MNTSLHSSDYITRIAINESSSCLPKTNWHPRDAQGENMIPYREIACSPQEASEGFIRDV